MSTVAIQDHERMPDTERDYVFAQRNELIALVSMLFPAHLTIDTDNDWEWNRVVCIHLPTGQIRYHVSDEFADRLGWLGMTPDDWDGESARSERIWELMEEGA